MFSYSKIQKYSPTESAKVYDKAVNRKNNVNFHPRQTIDFISNNMAHATLSNEIKRRVVRQYLDVSNGAGCLMYITDNGYWATALLSNNFIFTVICLRAWQLDEDVRGRCLTAVQRITCVPVS